MPAHASAQAAGGHDHHRGLGGLASPPGGMGGMFDKDHAKAYGAGLSPSFPFEREPRRTKSVITPEGCKRVGGAGGSEALKFGPSPLSGGESPRTWISVKVSPTLETGERGGALGGRHGSAAWGTDRQEFSNALKTINSKLRSGGVGNDGVGGDAAAASCFSSSQLVSVDMVNATAQGNQGGSGSGGGGAKKKPSPPKGRSGVHPTSSSSGGGGNSDGLPSPPTAGFARSAHARSSHARGGAGSGGNGSHLFLRQSLAESPLPAKPVPGLGGALPLTKGPAQPSLAVGKGGAAPNGSAPRDADAERRKPCNCKNSKCLKLYCDCFAMSQCVSKTLLFS